MGSRLLLLCVLVALAIGALVLWTSRPVGHSTALPPPEPVELAPDLPAEPRLDATPGEQGERSSAVRVPASVEVSTLPPVSGAWLRGRLTSAERSTWGGYRIGLVELDESGDSEAWRQRADRAWESIRPVDPDGRFTLGPFPAGRVRIDLHRPTELVWRDVGEGDWNRLTIGEVVLAEGVVLERDFEVSERAGQLVVAVRVNGVPVEGLEVQLLRDEGCRATGLTDPSGRFGPFPVLAGSLRVRVSDPVRGWRHVHPLPIVAVPGATVEALVTVEVVTARVLFAARASGAPLAHRRVAVLDAEGIPLTWSNLTDGEGGVTFSLVPGDYRFELNPGDAPTFALDGSNRSGVLPWTYQGLLVGRVVL